MKQNEAQTLSEWFLQNQRPLPWRKNKDPYQIWISEVMLQQTTVAAVTPYFAKFIKKFPNFKSLAKSPLGDVLEMWAGLGYYSRARNLHKASQKISQLGNFPKSAQQLLELPGFGPYTSRAVASIAFGEKVGVLDGNVIRVLSRMYGLSLEWWMTAGRKSLQSISDELVSYGNPSDINQGLMELGATVCTPKKPLCLICPWNKSCVSLKQNKIDQLPLSKPKKSAEYWLWKPKILIKNKKVALVENNYAPFLKGQWLFPGIAKQSQTKPKKFNLKHGITHHDIFIQIDTKAQSDQRVRWVPLKDLKKINPASLMTKVLSYIERPQK